MLAVILGALPWPALATLLTIGQAWSNLRIALSETEPASLAKLHLELGILMLGAILFSPVFPL